MFLFKRKEKKRKEKKRKEKKRKEKKRKEKKRKEKKRKEKKRKEKKRKEKKRKEKKRKEKKRKEKKRKEKKRKEKKRKEKKRKEKKRKEKKRKEKKRKEKKRKEKKRKEKEKKSVSEMFCVRCEHEPNTCDKISDKSYLNTSLQKTKQRLGLTITSDQNPCTECSCGAQLPLACGQCLCPIATLPLGLSPKLNRRPTCPHNKASSRLLQHHREFGRSLPP